MSEMNARNCLEVLRKIKDVAFATVDEVGKPQVRIIDVMLVEGERLYFCTSRGKDFYQQLERDGNVAVTALTPEFQMVRLNGRARRLANQKEWIDRIFEENPSMNDVYPGDSRYVLEPFVIDSGEVEFFDLGVTPIRRESFPVGGGEVSKKGFVISDACIGCGKCLRGCPQQCIEEGTPFRIMQEHCLHCGRCFEGCPVQAILRR